MGYFFRRASGGILPFLDFARGGLLASRSKSAKKWYFFLIFGYFCIGFGGSQGVWGGPGWGGGCFCVGLTPLPRKPAAENWDWDVSETESRTSKIFKISKI